MSNPQNKPAVLPGLRTIPTGFPLFLFGCALYWVFSQLSVPAETVVPAMLAIAFLSLLIFGTLLIKYTQWATANPEIEPYDPWSEPGSDELFEKIRNDETSIEDIGFSSLGHFRVVLGGPHRNRAFVTLFENQNAKQIAQLSTILIEANLQRRSVTTLLFATEFDDGTKLATSNNAPLSIFPPVRMREGSMSFPKVRDARRLYEIHQASLDRFAGNATRLTPQIDDPADFVRLSIRKETAKFEECGYFYLDREREIYRPTWKGACLGAWKSTWPVKSIRAMRRRQKASQLLREIGLS